MRIFLWGPINQIKLNQIKFSVSGPEDILEVYAGILSDTNQKSILDSIVVSGLKHVFFAVWIVGHWSLK